MDSEAGHGLPWSWESGRPWGPRDPAGLCSSSPQPSPTYFLASTARRWKCDIHPAVKRNPADLPCHPVPSASHCHTSWDDSQDQRASGIDSQPRFPPPKRKAGLRCSESSFNECSKYTFTGLQVNFMVMEANEPPAQTTGMWVPKRLGRGQHIHATKEVPWDSYLPPPLPKDLL